MKKGYFKTLAALAAGAMLLSMNMSAFALEYTASTTYKDDNTATVNVTDVAATAGDEVAFLAQNGETIIYVDQKTAGADGKVGNFSFDIDLTDAAATPTIKVGSTSTAAGDAKTIKIGEKTITLKSDGNGFVGFADTEIKDYDGTKDIADVTGKAYSGQITIAFYAAPAAGYKVDKVQVDSESAKEVIVSVDGVYTATVDGEADHTITVTFVQKSGVTAQATAESATVSSDGKTLTVLGKANTSDCGIKVDEQKYAALVTNSDGAFCVVLDASGTETTFTTGTSVTVYDGEETASATVSAAE